MSAVPEPWAEAMSRKGFTWRGVPSLSRLAAVAELSVETVRRMALRIGTPTDEAIAKVSAALGTDVSGWVGRKPTHDPYVGPDASRHLNDRQRKALPELINALLDVEDGTDAHSAEAPEKTQPSAVTPLRAPDPRYDPDVTRQRAARRGTKAADHLSDDGT